MINATIAGNIGKDAVTRNAGSTTVTGFSVAVEQRGKDGKKTQWVNVSFWGKRGEVLAQYLTKGGRVAVAGELTTREYEGKTYLELEASNVTLMGGGQSGGSDDRGSDYGQGAGGASAGGAGGYDDGDIPFAPEVRI